MKALEGTIDQYHRGAITDTECAIRAVLLLDASNTNAILQSLPIPVQAKLHSWLKNWNGGNIRTTALDADLPATKLTNAKHWFDEHSARSTLKKIRELKAMLKKAGFLSRQAKGHTFWWHAVHKSASVTLCGNDGDGARPYLENEVKTAIRKAGGTP